MPLVILAVALLLPLIFIVLVPVSLIMRYRAGTTRRRARGWVATINLGGLVISAICYLLAAAIATIWAPGAFTMALAGLAGGSALGLVGLLLTRWESAAGSLHYTPNRWLVLTITVVVSLRLLYGIWRGWHAWSAPVSDSSWLAASGAAGSFAAGAVVLGYYLAYWAGVRYRHRRHARA